MKVGVTGAGGLLGSTLVPLWRQAGADVIAWRRGDLDVTDEEAVFAAVRGARPDVVVHAAGYTDVDRAEAEPEEAMRVNGGGTASVRRACEAVGARLVYLSTDYVFDGSAGSPIPPYSVPSPIGAYARSKEAGERAVREARCPWLIARTGWAYGPGGQNFVDTIREAAVSGRQVTVVADQEGAPTSTRLISETLWALLMARVEKHWHIAAGGHTSWFEVARAVFRAARVPEELVYPCSSGERGGAAPRPAYAVLDASGTAALLVGTTVPNWEEHVSAYVRTGVLPGIGVIGGTRS